MIFELEGGSPLCDVEWRPYNIGNHSKPMDS